VISLELGRTAVLVLDLQAEILPRIGPRAAPLLERAAGVVAAAREARVAVIFVVVGFRPGYPELDPRNATFGAVAQSGRFLAAPPGSDLPLPVRPRDGEVVVVKHRVSAFAGTDLEMILRARRIDTLVLLGIATGGVVLSTVRQAADADYRLVVVEDCCADADDEVHRVLTRKVLPRQATVAPADEVLAALRAV
jgi:nicotinamidase-related amidase